jgi:hypothetical protein
LDGARQYGALVETDQLGKGMDMAIGVHAMDREGGVGAVEQRPAKGVAGGGPTPKGDDLSPGFGISQSPVDGGCAGAQGGGQLGPRGGSKGA